MIEETGPALLQPMSAAEWDTAYLRPSLPWDEPPPAEFLRLARRHLPPPAQVLDVGCGTGSTTRTLAAVGYEVLGLDISRSAIRLARESTPAGSRCRYVVQDVVAVAADTEPVDLVVDRGVLHAQCNPAAQRRFVQAVATVCRAGGYWLHVGAMAEDDVGSTFFRHGPSALTERDFTDLIRPWFRVRQSITRPYGETAGETDFPCRFAVLQRQSET